MTSCRWPCSAWTRGERLERGDAVRLALADADEDAARERDAQLAGRRDRLQAAGRVLGRRALVGDEIGVGGFEHEALRGRHLAQPREVVAPEHPEVRVRQQPALERALARPHDVADEVVVAVLVQQRAHAGVDLRPLARQHEQLLDVAPGGAVEELQDLVRRVQVRPVRRERAVLAVAAARARQRERQVAAEGDPPAHRSKSRSPRKFAPGPARRRPAASPYARRRHGPLAACGAPGRRRAGPRSLRVRAPGRRPRQGRDAAAGLPAERDPHRDLPGRRARLRRRARREPPHPRPVGLHGRGEAPRLGPGRARDPRHPRPGARARTRPRPRRRHGDRAGAAGVDPRRSRVSRARATSRAAASASPACRATTRSCARSSPATGATPTRSARRRSASRPSPAS